MRPTPEEESGEPPRPPWHWVGFGTAAVFVVWLPLAYVAEAIKARLVARMVGEHGSLEETAAAIRALPEHERTKLLLVTIGIPLVPLLVASFCGGFLVGRWGGEHATLREAILAGFAAGLLVAGLTVASGAGISWVPLVVLIPTTLAAAAGGHVGLRLRFARSFKG